ncbi:MAG: YcnI family protein [Xanthobacteraceae bacterium]
MIRSLCFGAAGALAGICSAFAHVTLERQEAPVGSSYKAVLRVPHGCSGSPTTAIRVRIPQGVIAVKPMPKPGWTLDVVTGMYAKPFTLRGAEITHGVTEIAWSGGSLADAHYDEFVFRGTIAAELQPGGMIYFPVVQQCVKGVHRWIDIPKTQDLHNRGHGGPDPAPGLKLMPKR